MLDFLGDLRRTHRCGEPRVADAGRKIVLMGWVNKRRDHGKLIFIDLRDRTGITQVVVDAESNPAAHKKAEALRLEYVIAVVGRVKKRDPDAINPKIPTGEIEVVCDELRLLNEAKTPPFLPGETALPNEEMRLKYRYIDLRRDPMQANIELRHKVALAIRQNLSEQGFFEIETPFMTRSTPEGARDYLVPSRVYPGSFYALPQSPQLFKQILMISGFDRYFQIVRCFRDEDLRADRQPEFTQIDLEMSYPQQEQVFEVVEKFLTAAFAAAGVKIATPFPQMPYDQAIRLYGSDKPDLRLPGLSDVKDLFTAEMMQTLALEPELPIVAVHIPKVGELSRKERDDNKAQFAGKGGAKLLDDLKRLEKSWPEAVAKIKECVAQPPSAVQDKAGVAQPPSAVQDLIVIVGGSPMRDKAPAYLRKAALAVYTAAGAFRLEMARKYAERHGAFAGDRKAASSYHFVWVTDFPMFEWDENEHRWNAAHHPFTSPHEADLEKVIAGSDLDTVRSGAYDVVLNGTELGSGSIRIHRQDVQRAIFKALGMSEEEARSRFGFFLEALEYGTPPHGGIALGLDRIVMILAGADSLREVIPFPKTAKAVDLMVDAPSHIEQPQEDELELMTAWPHLGQRERVLADFCDRLLRFADQNLFTLRFPFEESTLFQRAIGLALAKAYNDARGAIKLAKAGYGPQAAAVCRSVVEAFINVRYIAAAEREDRADAFLKSVRDESKRLAKRLMMHDVDNELVKEAMQLESDTRWPLQIRDRAYAVEKPSYAYDVVFQLLSQLVHSSISSLAGHLKMAEPGFNIRVGRGNEWVDTALATVFIFFYEVCVVTCDALKVAPSELEPLRRAFHEFTEGYERNLSVTDSGS